jgi:hypothetical protein
MIITDAWLTKGHVIQRRGDRLALAQLVACITLMLVAAF